jgi:4-hydroxy-tetrahydrodipicolinate synthase
MTGTEAMLAEAVTAGAHGAVPGGANLFPRLFVDLYEKSVRGDRLATDVIQARIVEIGARLYAVGGDPNDYLKGLKCALSWLGICPDVMAEPLHRFGEADRQEVRRRLDAIRVAMAGVASGGWGTGDG